MKQAIAFRGVQIAFVRAHRDELSREAFDRAISQMSEEIKEQLNQ